MIRVMYLSKATRSFSEREMQSMCYRFAGANARRGLTGVLIRIGNYFIQILEGDDDEVVGVLEKIERDPRHTAVTTLLEQPTDTRAFAEWSMNLIDCERMYYVNLPQLAELREQIDDFVNGVPDNKKLLSSLILQMVNHVRGAAPRAVR